MQSSSGAKNPPWARTNVNTNLTGMNPQIMDANSMMSQQSMMQYQQTPTVFNPTMMQAQGGMTMPVASQMQMNQIAQGQIYPGNVVAYPTPRAVNPGIYQNAQANMTQPSNSEQRVFTGTVTKVHNDFGFVDHDVFYQTSVCSKGIIPKLNDRVLVEATYNANMPFKWNATRIQVLPKSGPISKPNNPKSNSYNAVPPPANKNRPPSNRHDDRDNRPIRRDDRDSRKRTRSRTRSRSRDRRESRGHRMSPLRKRPVVREPTPVKYTVRVPRIPLDIQKLDVPAIAHRYTNLYIPSDFFNAYIKWNEAFPPQSSFSLNNTCSYHIMSKEIENPNQNDAILEPPDADYRFSAKVMLISMPTLESMYQKCGLTKCDEKDKRSSKSAQHPTRLIKFLVGQKGKSTEHFAIGGPWSPSLDGPNPQTDPGVLVKTAIRTCKALTGIDLSSCMQWYRMVEFYYWRESGGKSRLETVVLFLPDVWSAQPSRSEWANIQDHYKAACDAALKKLDGDQTTSAPDDIQQSQAATGVDIGAESAEKSQIEIISANDSTITIDENDDEDAPVPTHYSNIDLKTWKVDQLRQELRARKVSCKGLRAQLVSRLSKLLKAEEDKETKGDDDAMEVEDEETSNNNGTKDTNDQNIEDSKKTEASKKTDEENKEEKLIDMKDDVKKDKDDDKKDKDDVKKDKDDVKKDKDVKPEEKKKIKTDKEIEEEKKKIEKEKQNLKRNYEIPSSPHFLVHPSTTAKGGKFSCNVASLSLLLDYRITDNKEHSFEIFVFAELFNEMLMRDFGFYLYKTLYTLPEKQEEVKESKDKAKVEVDKSEEVKDADRKDEKEKKEERIEKKDDKDRRDDKRDSRKRERKDSHSDDDGSSTPKNRSCGVDLPPDPYLLLSLVYFDTSRSNTINRKDLQSLFLSLGLQLSRSQIKSLLDKVCIKEIFNYRSLVQAIRDLSTESAELMQDLTLDTASTDGNVTSEIADLETAIATGNRELLPVFNKNTVEGDSNTVETKDVSNTGLVVYKSRVVDIAALIASEARHASSRQKLESALEVAKAALRQARHAVEQRQLAERGAQSQLSDTSAHLAAARARISSLTASAKIFHSALKAIQTKVDAVVNIKFEEEDVELVNGPTKVERKPKQEVKKESSGAAAKVAPQSATGECKPKTEISDSCGKEKDMISTEILEIADDKE